MSHDRPVERRLQPDLITSVMWQRNGQISLEHFRLFRLPDKFILQGTLLAHTGTVPQEMHYIVSCGTDWVTQAVHVSILEGSHVRSLQLQRDAAGIWRRDNEPLPEFEGLVDVDLQITPSTNTLPIRRLKLNVGQAADTDALWVRFPALTLERLPQRYTRLAEMQYIYESAGGAFRADLEVDGEGVVVRYADIWQSV